MFGICFYGVVSEKGRESGIRWGGELSAGCPRCLWGGFRRAGGRGAEPRGKVLGAWRKQGSALARRAMLAVVWGVSGLMEHVGIMAVVAFLGFQVYGSSRRRSEGKEQESVDRVCVVGESGGVRRWRKCLVGVDL